MNEPRGSEQLTERVQDGRRSPVSAGHLLTQSRPDVVVRSSRALGVESGRPIVVVLGMHRSGTSLLSNVLHFLGVDMADTTDHVSPKNAGGFWERPELTAIHDEILAAIDRPIGRATHVLPFPPAWWRRKDVQALKLKLVAYVERELAKSSNLWGFKDPRTCRLLPLWWEVFRELNLRPLYVHAVRNPAEASVSMAQKSKARTMSAANGELMWLSYNYDIARFVTAEHPTIVVDYADWFSDGASVASRLAAEFEIGDDLTPEDIVECVASIVQREYRHQVEGADGVSSNIPLASMLYKVLTATTTQTEADLRALRGQLRLADLFFKSLAPAAEELDAAAVANATILEREARTEASLADQNLQWNAQTEALLADHAAAVADLRGRNEAAHDENAALRRGHHETIAKLMAARAALEEARKAAAAAKDLAVKGAQERASLAGQLAAMERDGNVLSERIEEASRRERQLAATNEIAIQQLAVAREESAVATEELAGLNAALESERNLSLERLAEATAHAARADHAQVQIAELQAATARLQRRERRIEPLLALAKDWRQAQFESRETIAMRDQLVGSLSAEVAGASAQIARLQAKLARRSDAQGSETTTFEWPVDPGSYEVRGQLSAVDRGGISGTITVVGRPDIVPIVEVRVEGKNVLSLMCTAVTPGDGLETGDHWQFAIPWHSFAPEYAGGDAVIRLAGINHVVGEAPIPLDLRRYHVAPAVLAAELVGGTVAEAEEYHRWLVMNELADDADRARDYYQRADGDWPVISVFIYGATSTPDGFAATIKSLANQVYERWEAYCIDAPQSVSAIDPRVRVVASAKVDAELANLDAEAQVSFVEANDLLSPTALMQLAHAAADAGDFALIYSDEDRIDGDTELRAMPLIKAGWSADLGLVQDYGSRLALVKRKQVSSLAGLTAAGVYELTLHAALSHPEGVIHVPYILYHRAVENVRAGGEIRSAVERVLSNPPASVTGAKLHAASGGGWSIEWPLPDPAPRVSLIVPTRDRVDLLRVCVEGFLHETNYPNLEVLIADNESSETETLSYLAKVSTHPRVKVIACPGEFNFSTINNLAATHASGTVIGLMNNDLKVIDPDWLRRMVTYAVRPDVGIVGAKLLHADDTIQHAGVTLGIGTASHLYKSFPPDAAGRNGRLILPQDVSAVTAACLLMRRDVWNEVSGLDEDFPVAYNDVDLCLKVREAGYRIVWAPEVLVYHLESQSRGRDRTPEKRARLNEDRARLFERWGAQLARDPFHSPNLSDRHIDARLAFPSRISPPWRKMAPFNSEQSR